jgi:hypothetical protein
VLLAESVRAGARRARVPRRFGQAAGALRARPSPRRWQDRRGASYRQNSPPRTRSIHTGGNAASAPAGTPTRRRAACVGVRAQLDADALRGVSGKPPVPLRVGSRLGDGGQATAGRSRRARARSTPAETRECLGRTPAVRHGPDGAPASGRTRWWMCGRIFKSPQ